MTHRAWILVIAGYILLATGWAVSTFWIYHLGQGTKHNAERLNKQAAAFCAVSFAKDENEKILLFRLSYSQKIALPKTCKRLYVELRG